MADPLAALDALLGAADALCFGDLDEATVDAASSVTADVLAAAASGLAHPELATYAARVPAIPKDGRGALLLTSRPRWTTPQQTAFVHGCAAVADELDESLRGGGHPGAHVVPAAVAVAQAERRSGPELLTAIVAGYEVAGQLFRTYRPVFPAHPHGFYGGIGAAVACAKLAGVPARTCAAVVGAAPILAGWAVSLSGATARNTQVGLAAQQGVLAAELVRAGFTGDTRAIVEALPKQVGVPVEDGPPLPEEAGRPLLVNESTVRVHPVAGPLQPAVEAALALGPIGGADIDRIRVLVPQRVRKFAAPPEPNDLSARFSLPYTVLAALLTGTTEPVNFRYSADVAALTGLVTVDVHDDRLETTALEVTLASGEVRGRTMAPRPPRPYDPPLSDDVRAKWSGTDAGPLVARVLRLPGRSDTDHLFAEAS